MFTHIPDHFSSKFRFNPEKFPTSATDRSPALFFIGGWLFGTMLLVLGIFEFISFINAEKESNHPFLVMEFLAVSVILIALGLIIGSTFSFIRSKKIYFDGNEFKIVYRPAVGIAHQLTEPVANYVGVRLRVLFIQSGLFNKNRYIIDLYHRDENKIIPLYISTNNKNIRKIWENYAKFFKLPALSIGDRGLIQRDYTDLDKSLKELSVAGKLPFIASGKFPAPESIAIHEEKHATTVEPTTVFWDTFSTLFLFIAISAVFLLIAGGVYMTIIGYTLPWKYWGLGAVLFSAVLYFAARLFKSYTLVIEDDRISLKETLMGSVLRTTGIASDKIESVELSYNPIIDRYNLTIISDDEIVTFGSRLPVADLLWLKDFVIRKLIGN